MKETEVVPILYPYDLTKPLPRRIHDLNKNLVNHVNQTPIDGWTPGDTCFYYDRDARAVRFAVVTDIASKTSMTVQDLIGDRSGKSTLLDITEAFQTKEDITKALFGPPPD